MPFFNPVNYSPNSLKSKTLIVPIVSVANISQLAVDLLIATYDLSLIGIFDSKDLIPVIGAKENGEEGVTTPLELYGKAGLDIVVVQQRSPALKARKESFVQSFLTFAQEYQLGSLLFLAGVDLISRTDSQMYTPIYSLVPNQSPSLPHTSLSKIELLPRYEYKSSDSVTPLQKQTKAGLPFIPGGGLTRRFLSTIPDKWQIPTACVLQYVLEGDNREDALLLSGVVAQLLFPNYSNIEWKQPGSWKEGLFGTPHDHTLFG